MISPRILFVTPSAYILSGLAIWLDYLNPGLCAKGWNVTIGLVEGPRHHRPKQYVTEHPAKQWLSISCRTGTPEGRIRAVVRSIRDVQPDIVVSVNIPDAYAAVWRLRHQKMPAPKIVMSLHGIQADLYDDIAAFVPVLDGVACTNRLACRLAHVLSKMPGKRIYYAPCGSDVSVIRPHPVEKDVLEIAYIGRLEQWQKRIRDIPLILGHLDGMNIPYKLLIAGNGPDEAFLRQALERFVQREKVQFLGKLNMSELQSRVYKKADVLLLTSLWETGPIVVWEAMAAGLAVVSSRYIGSGLEGALEHEKNALLFPIGDTDMAALCLARLWNDSGLKRRLVENAKEMVMWRYSIGVSIQHWDDAFRKILKSNELSEPARPNWQPATGRLEKWFKPELAETLRELSGAQGPDSGPGGEWPHTYGNTPNDDPEFWQMAKEEDAVNRAESQFYNLNAAKE